MTDFLFGTVGAPKSTPAKPGGSVGAIQQLHALNLNAFELGWVQSVRVSEETCKAIRETSVQNGVALSVHAPYFINLNANDEEWPKSRQRLMDAAYYGALAGTTDIIFHPGSYFEQPRDEVLRRAIARLAGCAAELKQTAIIATLRPETMGKAALLGSFEDALFMSREVENVLPCLDFAHLHARAGDGSANTYAEWSQMLDQYGKELGEASLQKLHIHLSGIEYGPKGEKNHLPVRESDLRIEELFRALKDHHCAGRIVCESPIMEEDAIFMKELYEK